MTMNEQTRIFVASQRLSEPSLRYARRDAAVEEDGWRTVRREVGDNLMAAMEPGASYVVRITKVREPWEYINGEPVGLRLEMRAEMTSDQG